MQRPTHDPTLPAMPRQGVVLAAGEGKRLRPLTAALPKPLIPFLGRPLLDHAVAHLVRAGVERIAVNAHYLGHLIDAHVHGVLAPRYPQVAFHVSHEPCLLGTGGALRQLDGWLYNEPFWVVNADTVFAESLAQLAHRHAQARADATLLVTRDPGLIHLRRLHLDPHGELRGLYEPHHIDGAVFCGVQLAERTLIDRLPAGPSCSIRQGYLPYVAHGLRVATHETREFWSDVGTHDRFAHALAAAPAHLPAP